MGQKDLEISQKSLLGLGIINKDRFLEMQQPVAKVNTYISYVNNVGYISIVIQDFL